MRVELAVLAVLCAAPLARARADDDTRQYDPRALAVYEEGKRLYDAKQYRPALEKFDEAARLEPTAARWQYNRGLAQKKLGAQSDARAAFVKAFALDPTYKRAEIDQKLREMGYPALEVGVAPPKPPSVDWKPRPEPEPSRGSGFVIALLIGAVVVVGGLWWLVRTKGAPAAPARPAMDPAAQAALRSRLGAIQKSLVALEHGFAAGEDPEARALLEQATGDAHDLERDLSYSLHLGDDASLSPRLATVEQLVAQAFAKLEAKFGPAVRTAQGPRVACFFCAKPLANDAVRRQIMLREKGADTPVLACPACAAEAEAGKAPEVRALRGGQGWRHWSSDPAFDPYSARHIPFAGGYERARFGELDQGIPLGKLALAAAGGMVLSTVAGVAVAHVLDLDGAREAFLSQAASNAVARRSADRDDRDWRDHS